MYAPVSTCPPVPVHIRAGADSRAFKLVPLLWSSSLYDLPTLILIFAKLFSRVSTRSSTVEIFIMGLRTLDIILAKLYSGWLCDNVYQSRL